MSSALKAGLAGVAAAAVAQFVALLLTGAGHGWIRPFWFSLWLWPLLPLTLVRLGQRRRQLALDAGLLLLAVVLDVALVLPPPEKASNISGPTSRWAGPWSLFGCPCGCHGKSARWSCWFARPELDRLIRPTV